MPFGKSKSEKKGPPPSGQTGYPVASYPTASYPTSNPPPPTYPQTSYQPMGAAGGPPPPPPNMPMAGQPLPGQGQQYAQYGQPPAYTAYNPNMPYYPNPGMAAPPPGPPGHTTVVVQGGFDAGARFTHGTTSLPPPPPGVMPSAAQVAQAQGHNVVVTRKEGNLMMGGSDGGYCIW